MNKALTFSLVLVMGFTAILSVQARTWTQAATGRKIEASMVKISGTNVVLKLANGQTVPVPINSLSVDDQSFIKENMASLSTAGSSGGGQNWPAFRGADGSDISPDTGLLKSWPSGGPKQVWVFKDAGMGYSGYSIVDGKLFTMGTKGSDVHMVCVDISNGSKVWSTSFAQDDKGGYNSGWGHGPRGTPTVSDGKVYGLGPKGTLACVDIGSGKVDWKKNLVSDFGGQGGSWGYSESPLVDGDKVVVAPGGNRSGIVALNKKTGSVIWEAKEVTPGKAEYATILSANINNQPQYVKFFEKSITSVDASSGKLLWQAPFPKGKTAVIPTPIISGNQVYVSAGYGAGCSAFEISASNQVTNLYANGNMLNHHGGVIKLGDHVYGIHDSKGLLCQDWKSGEEVWKHKDRQFLSKGAITIADGMIYAVNEQNGAVTLAAASPEGYSEKGRFTLAPQSEQRPSRGKVWAHPVVIGGKLYLRDQELVHCYDVKN